MGMTFMHPEFLYLMLPPVLVLFYFLLTQREAIAGFFSEESYNRLRVNSKRLPLRVRNVLFLLMFICFIVALAQPVIEEGKVTVQAKSADIMIALDISDSMRAEDVYPSRLELGKQKILELLALTPQERIGVSAFARASYLVAPLSFDHRAVQFLVRQLQPSYITEKGTDFAQLLKSAAKMMSENKEKYLLILTDGGDSKDFSEEIALAKSEGIKIFVLGIGTEKGAPIKNSEGGFVKDEGKIVVTTLNSAVADLATGTGGTYIESVASNEDITAMFGEITAKTRKRRLKEEEITQYIQLFYIPLGLGMLLLLIATSSMSRREKVHVPLALAAAVMLAHPLSSEAGLLDFRVLDEAKQAYMAEDFNRSASLYGEYASHHRNAASLYNTASALYKQGRYAEAAREFEQVQFKEPSKQFDALHNLGNAYAKQGTPEALQQAVKAYEKALKIKEEAPTRENLETVKKLLKQQEQQQQGQRPPQNGKQGDKKPKEPGKEQQQPPQEGQEGAQSSGDSSQQEAKGETPSPQKSSAKEPKTSLGKEDAKQSDADEQQQPENASQVRQAKSAQDEDTKKEEAAKAAAASQTEEGRDGEPVMSDLEAQKWLKRLSEQPVSHIYRIGGENESSKREDEDEKPW